MTLLLTLLAAAVALLVTLVTCIQLLYLESLRVRTRELPALQFFREALEPKIGLETERGALTFSLVKHIGLGILGCLIVAITMARLPFMGSAGGGVSADRPGHRAGRAPGSADRVSQDRPAKGWRRWCRCFAHWL